MRVTTLKVSAERLGGLLSYYAGLAEACGRSTPARGPVDYYLDPDEPPGRWWGNGRTALGVDGPVAAEDLRAVLEGHHPVSGTGLGRRFGDVSARGFDATFSAPKSVSVLWALTPDPWVRAEVLAAHDAAVDSALEWFECHGAVTRRGTDGVFQVDTQGITAALFRQHTSRTMDPQLHTHAVISAKVQDRTGRWLSLDARFLKYQQRSISAVYDAGLRAELTARLGVDWVERGAGLFDLACVPEGVREEFSQRSEQVNAKLAELVRRWRDEHDGAEPDARTIARIERDAARTSRPSKLHGLDAEYLRGEWADQAHRLGFDPTGLTSDRVVGESPWARPPDDEDLVDEALYHAAEESASWLRADIARHMAAILGPNTARTGEQLVVEIDRLASLAEQRCVPLGPDHDDTTRRRRDGRPVTEHVTDRRLTLPRVLRQEYDLQTWAAASIEPVASTPDPQRTAAEAISGSAGLVLVVGPAGTGKTYTTATAVAVLQGEGRPVVGLAPSGKAADVLATAADCPTDTAAGFLARHHNRPSPWQAGTTVILDEAAMTATVDLIQLVELVRVNRWRLVAVGDPEQLPSVTRGGVFAHWCDTLDHHTLDTPRRFTEEWEAAASLGLRAGRSDAITAYFEHGRLHSSHPATVAQQVAAAHRAHRDAGRSVAVTTTNAETAKAINTEIQRQRNPTGSSVRLRDGTTVFAGDQVATRRNDKRLVTTGGEQVRNRHTWTVTAVHSDGALTVEHSDRGSVDLPAGYVDAQVELGWAVTGYGTQGDTVDIGIAVLEASTSRNHAYVAMTRGRHANHAVLPDPTGTEDPAEQLAQIIARPASAESALAVQQRLHRAAGAEPPTPDDGVGPVTTNIDSGSGPVELAFQRQVDAMTRRLDAIQHRPPSRGGEGLGL